MISIPELSVETREMKADQSVLVLEPLRPQSGLDPVILTPGRYTIGSSADCEIILNSHRISPRHCLIIAGKNQTVLKAWNSRTLVNEVPVEEAVLHPNDRLSIGPIEFQVREASQKKPFDQDAQAVRLESSVKNVNGKDSETARSRSRELSARLSSPMSESPFGSERFSRALDRVIESGQVLDSDSAQAVKHVQTQPTRDSVKQRLREREQELNQQDQDLEERRTEFEKQRSDQESLIQAKERDLNLQEDSLRKRECELAARQDKWSRTCDELDAEFQTARQELEERRTQREEHLEAREEAFAGREENLAGLMSETESRKIFLEQQWDELKTKNQTFAEETSLLEVRQARLAGEESRLKSEQNLFIESQSQFSEEKKQFDDARQTFRLEREQLEKDRNCLSENRATLDTERDEFEHEKSQLQVELGNLTEEQARITQEQTECSEERASNEKENSRIKEEKSEFKVVKLQIRENLLRLAKDYESFSKQRDALEEKTSQFDVEQEKLAVEQKNLKADQTRLAEEQKDVSKSRASLEYEQNKFEEQKSQLEVEQGKIKDEQTHVAEEQKHFNENRLAFDKERTRFQDEKSQFEEKQKLLEENQVRLDKEQGDLNQKLSALDAERAEFEDEQSQLEVERKRIKDDQTRLCEEFKDLDENREDFKEQQDILQSEINANREELDRERIDLKAGEDELAKSSDAFKTEREEFASRQDQLEDDLEKYRRERESLELAKQELSQEKEDSETQREKLRAESEEFKSSQDEWKRQQESGSATRSLEELSEFDDDSSERDDPPLPRVFSSLPMSSDGGEIPDTGADAAESSPPDLNTETESLSEQILPIEVTDDPLSISNYMEGLLARSRKSQPEKHSNIDSENDETVLFSRCIENPEHATVPGDNENDHSCDDAENTDKRVTEEILMPVDSEDLSAPSHSQDTDALRFDLTTLRDVANLSARSAIAKHTSKKLRSKILVKMLLAVIGFSIAAVIQRSELWLNVSYKAFGIGAAAIAAVSVLEVIRCSFLVHEIGALKQESLHTSDAENVFAEEICEENT